MEFRNTILRTAAAAGVISVALTMPKFLKYLPRADRGVKHRQELYRRLHRSFRNLEQSGLIEREDTAKFRLTQRGRDMIDSLKFADYLIPEPAFWDGKWRIVIFDIREKRRKVRTHLRVLLNTAGFVRLQDSVWIFPYPCDEFIALIRTHLRSGTGELLSFTTDAMESDKKLREHFKLSDS